MKEIATHGYPDILFIEGYKEERGEKVVLLRDESDWDELQSFTRSITTRSRCHQAYANTSRSNDTLLDCWLLDWVKRGIPMKPFEIVETPIDLQKY